MRVFSKEAHVRLPQSYETRREGEGVMVWTDEMRAKAAATRAAKKARRNGGPTEALGHHEGHNGVSSSQPSSGRLSIPPVLEFDWEEAPLGEAINRAADLKREYERVQQIILRRRNPPRAMWTCWTEENRKTLEIPRKVLQECLRKGEDGKWKFRDDGRFVVVDGVRTLKPAFCCNYLCYSAYQKHRVTPPAREVAKLT